MPPYCKFINVSASGAPMTSGTTGGSLSGATMDGSMPQGSIPKTVEGGKSHNRWR